MPSATKMPILPISPDFDTLLESDLGTRLSAAIFAVAHRFVAGVRAKRTFAEAYVMAITRYLQSLGSCDYFGILETEIESGLSLSRAERQRCVKNRRDTRRDLDRLGMSLPTNIHETLVSYTTLGGRCGRLAA
jgi:hypothetical protein